MSYAYDGLGRRISKAVQGGTPTQFLYSGFNAVQETQGSAINPILIGPGVDERYARNDVTGRTYFLRDALGSTIALTDSTGAIREQYSYDPYGNTTSSDTTTGFTNPYQYTGREADASGLYYYRARYYSPPMGGFISEDPARSAGGQPSYYAYAGGDSIDYVDLLGLAQSLSYQNVSGGPTDPMWQIQWQLSDPSPNGGWIVQQIDMTLSDGTSQTYWEAWQVAPNSTVTTLTAANPSANSPMANLPIDDTFEGAKSITASARFYEGLNLPSSFVQGSVPYATGPRTTRKNPCLSIGSATPPVNRSWTPSI